MTSFTQQPSVDASLSMVEPKPLGERLLDAGLISGIQLNLALREQKRRKKFLGDTLVELGFISHDALAETLAKEAHTRTINVLDIVVPADVIAMVPYELAQRLRILPIERTDDTLIISMADTFDVMAVDMLEKTTGLRIEVVAAPEGDILDSLERHYAQNTSIDETVDQILRSETDVQPEENSSIIHLVNQIIVRGIVSSATDIHIEPGEKVVYIRLRVDGILRKEALIPRALQAAISTRIKIMAAMDVTEKRLPQDGRVRFHLGRQRVDLRTSTLPTTYGESIVMRILDQTPKSLSLQALGMSEHNRDIFSHLIKQPHGIILVTGPTGSGKTTTLYTALGQIDALEKSIFTMEDPIEYSLPMVRQTQVNPDIGLSFAIGLRSLLRQDPDVILIGEIRDAETASLAVRAALTGHLVFSTLHTNDAAGAIPRLIDMGVEAYLLPSCLTGIIAQRLVRRICTACKCEVENPKAELEGLEHLLETTDDVTLWHGAGCEACHDTGYAGRISIHEILQLDADFHDIIVDSRGSTAINALAVKKGMQSLLMDGLSKALSGETSVQEVLRVAQ